MPPVIFLSAKNKVDDMIGPATWGRKISGQATTPDKLLETVRSVLNKVRERLFIPGCASIRPFEINLRGGVRSHRVRFALPGLVFSTWERHYFQGDLLANRASAPARRPPCRHMTLGTYSSRKRA
jgi:hypothetical protein